MNVKDLKSDDRPRERLFNLGPRALSDVELLAILIGSGTKQNTVFDIASSVLKSYSLSELRGLNLEKLIKIKGLKKAKACQLLACFEIARRSIQKNELKVSFDHPKDIYDYIYEEIYFETHEIIVAILCDCKLHPIKMVVERSEYAHQIAFPLKKIISEALGLNAYGVVLVHNHPSGDVKPSTVDIETTYVIKEILMRLDILLLDHLVVCSDDFYSMHEHGLLSEKNEYSILGDFLEETDV